MTKRWKGLTLAAGVAALMASAQAAPPSPAMLANACAGCHGTNGASAGPSMPSLAGQSKIATVEAMKGFKSGERPSSIMGRIAKGYSDADFEAMGDFFAKMKPAPAAQTTTAARVARGKDLHEKNCKRCHLENGKEYDENAAIMAGQWLQYLQIQMDDYHSGKRKMFDKKAERMKPLTREQLEDLAHFYAAQR